MQSKHWKHPGSPPPKNLRGFIQRGGGGGGSGWWFRSFGIVKRWPWWLSWARSHDKRFILCRRIEAATPGNRQKEARETESRCSALAVQRPCLTSQVDMTAATECWFEILFSSPIFSWFGSWLLSVPKTEIQASWSTVWKQWRRHRGSKKYFGDQEQTFYFWRDNLRKLEQRWTKRIVLKGDYIKK